MDAWPPGKSAVSRHQPSAGGTLLVGVITVGVLDLLAAWVTRDPRTWASFVHVTQSIAGGLLGRATFEGGAATAVLGTAIHFTIATAVVITLYAAARRFPALARHPLPVGIGYGAVVYAVMYVVVLPLSAWHAPVVRPPEDVAKNLAIHLGCIGVPAALFVRTAIITRTASP